jgi:hypothetical protein
MWLPLADVIPAEPNASVSSPEGVKVYVCFGPSLDIWFWLIVFLQEGVDNSLVENGVLIVSVLKSTPELAPKKIVINEFLFDCESLSF